MAILTPKYNAALPAGFTSGTLEIRYPSGVYVDSAGRASQAYYKATIQSNGTLINPQTGQALTIIGAGSGDPASQPIQVVVTLNVGALPSPNRFTRSIPNVFTSGSDLNIFTPNYNVPTVIAPNDAVANAIAATGSAVAATSAANAAAAAANDATANIGAAIDDAAAQAVTGVQGQVTAALAPVAPALADIAQTEQQLLAAVNRIPWTGTELNLPAPAGDYLLTRGAKAGQVWTRTANGTAPYRNYGLEAPPETRGLDITPEFFAWHIRHPARTNWNEGPLGITTWRFWETSTAWLNLETAPGVWNWTLLDSLLAQAEGKGVRSLMCLGQAPAFYTGNVSTGGTRYNALHPTDLTKWDAYVTAIATRYRGRITDWEVWNEPNLSTFYQGTPAQMAELTRRAVAILHAIDPNNRVFSASPTGLRGALWAEQYLSDPGGLGDIDGFAMHAYVQPRQPEEIIPLTLAYRDALARHGLGHLPLWNTEWSYHIHTDDNGMLQLISDFGTGADAMTAAQGRNWLARSVLAQAAAGIERNYLFAPDDNYSSLRLMDSATNWQTLTPHADGIIATRRELLGWRVVNWTAAQGVYQLALFNPATRARKIIAWTQDGSRVPPVALTAAAGRRSLLDDTPQPLAGPITRDPAVFDLREDSGTGRAGDTRGVQGDGVTYNPTFRQGGAGWSITGGTLATYAGSDAPAGTTPATFTAAGQFNALFQRAYLVPGARYSLSITYKTASSTMKISLEDGAGQYLDLGITLAATTEFQTVATTLTVPPANSPEFVTQRVVEIGTAPFTPIHVADYRLVRLDPPIPEGLPYRTVHLPGLPTTGNFQRGDVVRFTDPTTIAQRGLGVICTTSGTLGGPAGVTGTVTGAPTAQLQTSADLPVGAVVQIAGVTGTFTLGKKQKSSNITTYTTDTRMFQSVTDAAITFVAPVFAPLVGSDFDASALAAKAWLTSKLSGAAYYPGITQLGDERHALPAGALNINGSGELGLEGWTLISGTLPITAVATTGRQFRGGEFEMRQDVPVFRANNTLWLTCDAQTVPAGTTLEVRAELLDNNGAFVSVLLDYTGVAQQASKNFGVMLDNAQVGGSVRIKVRGTGAALKFFQNVYLWAGLPGLPVATQQGDLTWINNKVNASTTTLNTLTAKTWLTSTLNGAAYFPGTGVVGDERQVTPIGALTLNGSGELGTDGWTVVSGSITSAVATTGRQLRGGEFEIRQDVPAFRAGNQLWLTCDAQTVPNGTTLEVRVEVLDNALAVVATPLPWTGIVQQASKNYSVVLDNAQATGFVRLSVRGTGAAQKFFQGTYLWAGLPGIPNATPFASTYWLYANKVSTTQAATTAVMGLVKRAAALTAAAVPSTALTAGATYSQPEAQAIITRLEAERARREDLEVKLRAAGIIT